MSYAVRERKGRIVCEVCDRPMTYAGTSMMCSPCGKLYDLAQHRIFSGDTWDVMVWTARRARAFAMKAAR